jgi:tetratricopeptide (TPR) repeat protein
MADPKDENLQLSRARELFRNKEFFDAIRLLKSIVRSSELHEAYWLLARASYLTNDWREAACAARKAKDLRPGEAKYNALLARSLTKFGDFAGADHAWRAALQHESAPAAWHAGFASVCQACGKFEEAIRQYEYAISRTSSPPNAWMHRLGMCALRSHGDRPLKGLARSAARKVQDRYVPELRALAKSGAVIALDLVGDPTKCAPTCPAIIRSRGRWVLSYFAGTLSACKFSRDILSHRELSDHLDEYVVPALPIAMIVTPEKYEEYLEAIGPKSRNMLRKVERRGYTFHRFNRNDHLHDLHEINTSKELRGGRIMTSEYRQFPQPTSGGNGSYCSQHHVIYHGCFRGKKLVAYCSIQYLHELGIVDLILGHGAYLADGIMNGLIASIVKDCIATRSIKCLSYLTLVSGRPELVGFKKRVGFKSYAVFINLNSLKTVVGDVLPAPFREKIIDYLGRRLWLSLSSR